MKIVITKGIRIERRRINKMRNLCYSSDIARREFVLRVKMSFLEKIIFLFTGELRVPEYMLYGVKEDK